MTTPPTLREYWIIDGRAHGGKLKVFQTLAESEREIERIQREYREHKYERIKVVEVPQALAELRGKLEGK